jgi:uncharacterized membrane protein
MKPTIDPRRPLPGRQRDSAPQPSITISKNRLVSFSDGVIAIIITIMVLNIPLPTTFDTDSVLRLLGSILVFFVSFIVVGAQWNKHHFLMEGVQSVSNQMVWRTLIFLFLLSLVPIFTKWVMQNPDEPVPAIGYDVVFLLVNGSYLFIWSSVVHQRGNEEKRREFERMNPRAKFFWWLRFALMGGIFLVIILLTELNPRISSIVFIGFPVASSLINLFIENNRSIAIAR